MHETKTASMPNNPEQGPSKEDTHTARQAGPQDDRRKSLQTTITNLENQIVATQSQLKEVNSQLRSPNNPSQTVQSHIRLLHDYNEIRDIGQGLLGLIADRRGVRYGDVLEEFGVDADD